MTSASPRWQVHPDRLLPADPHVRTIARRIYDNVSDLPIVSPHGHVDPRVLLDDEPFADPASLFVTPDHYVTRLLHADGVPLERLGVGQGPLSEAQSRRVWRLLCERWDLFAGTPMRAWLEAELVQIFEVPDRPSAATADATYDHVAERLTRPEYTPRALYDRFRISVLATTDDPCDDLGAHAALVADPSWSGRVIPTFRPDRYLEVGRTGWVDQVHRLSQASDLDATHYAGFIAALESRRRYFIENGATSADHSHRDVRTDPLEITEATRIFADAVAGTATADEAVALRRHLLCEMARMSCDDGLVMTLHPAVHRNHHPPTFDRFGADTGHDIPLAIEFTRALQPLLERYGTHPNLHLVLFTIDETTFSRELAPLAGFYPSVYLGPPWWFLDAPNAMRRWREAVTETVGFSRTSGFVDDTRAFCSIPARHDLSRRVDAGHLAALVADHSIAEEDAVAIAIDQASTRPRHVFKL